MSIWLGAVFVVHAIGFLSSISAVMTARISQGAIAWSISLNTCPCVAVPAYWKPFTGSIFGMVMPFIGMTIRKSKRKKT